MKTNDSIPADAREDVIELGVASVETQGILMPTNEPTGTIVPPGITE